MRGAIKKGEIFFVLVIKLGQRDMKEVERKLVDKVLSVDYFVFMKFFIFVMKFQVFFKIYRVYYIQKSFF